MFHPKAAEAEICQTTEELVKAPRIFHPTNGSKRRSAPHKTPIKNATTRCQLQTTCVLKHQSSSAGLCAQRGLHPGPIEGTEGSYQSSSPAEYPILGRSPFPLRRSWLERNIVEYPILSRSPFPLRRSWLERNIVEYPILSMYEYPILSRSPFPLGLSWLERKIVAIIQELVQTPKGGWHTSSQSWK